MAPIAESSHCLVNDAKGVFLAFSGQMKIDHRGFKLRMSWIALNHTDIHACFKKMRGIRMPQGVDGDPSFADAGGIASLAERSLNTVNSHGIFSGRRLLAVAAQSRKKKLRMAVNYPVLTKQFERLLGKRDHPVYGSFASMDVDHLPVALDVRYLEIQAFLKPQPAGIDGRKVRIVVKSAYML